MRCLSLYFVETARTSEKLEKDSLARWSKKYPRKDAGPSPKLVWPAAFLASAASDFITGHVIDSGYIAQ